MPDFVHIKNEEVVLNVQPIKVAQMFDNNFDIVHFKQWRDEAMRALDDYRREAWRDFEMYDGQQWTAEDLDKAKDAGIHHPLTINRTFATINLILGMQIINQLDIIAKGRTKDDTELGEVMTEGLKYVMDQWRGTTLIRQAFKDAIIGGTGFLYCGYSNDPRKEKVKIDYRDWKEIWWDPYASPWLDVEKCRYVIHQRWMDLADLQVMFPEKRQEIEDAYKALSANKNTADGPLYDEATYVEEYNQWNLSNGWVAEKRKRVRPCEIWYSVYSTSLFALFPDGNVIEITDDMPPIEQYNIVTHASEVIKATVKKIRVATFLNDLLLADVPSPYKHDMYPFIPFIAYLNRFNRPFGVPRQLRDQEEEINRRRSMALALLNSRQVIMEEDAAGEVQNAQTIYDEANKPDGFVVVRTGALAQGKIQIKDQSPLMREQLLLLQDSEREIMQIAGTNAETLGYKSNAISGVAESRRAQQSFVILSNLFENLRLSLQIMGEQILSLAQNAWRGEKVLRITDRLSGAERFIAINKKIQNENGQIITINNIAQTKFDIVIANAPLNDTTRETYMLILMEIVKKAPPEAIPYLLMLSLELSDVPNKEQLLAKILPTMGIDPRDLEMSSEQLKQKAAQQIDIAAQKQSIIDQINLASLQLDLEEKKLALEKVKAEINQLLTRPVLEKGKLDILQDKVNVSKDRVRLDGIRTGMNFQDKEKDREHQAFLSQLNRNQNNPMQVGGEENDIGRGNSI